ncbi:MAG TPA: glycosyltransferase [Steroidobacteraceae bacterium]|jgi:GT2 family glycosyltransferase
MPNIDISIVIPTFRREAELLEAIDSVRRQTGISFEIIVVDDTAEGSARETVAAVSDPRVRYVLGKTPSNGIPALPRNEGARLAQGRYLYFLDDDDIMMPATLAVMSRALDSLPDTGMAFGTVEPFGAHEGWLRRSQEHFARARRIALKLRSPGELSAALVFSNSIIVNSACMARRSAFDAVGGYDTQIPVCEDADLWGRIAHGHRYVFLDRPVVRYRTGAPSLMHNLRQQDEKLRISYRRIQEKYRQVQGPIRYLACKLWVKAMIR